jgi:hypothetical protein
MQSNTGWNCLGLIPIITTSIIALEKASNLTPDKITSEPQFQPRRSQGNNIADPALINYFGGTGKIFGDRGKRC